MTSYLVHTHIFNGRYWKELPQFRVQAGAYHVAAARAVRIAKQDYVKPHTRVEALKVKLIRIRKVGTNGS